MIKYNLKFKHYTKTRNILSLFSNFYLFAISFEYLLSMPKYTFLFLSLTQNVIYHVKKFLFYKLSTLTLDVFKNKQFLLYKKKLKLFFLTHLYWTFIFYIVFQILSLVLKKIFSFIPNYFRMQGNKTSFTLKYNKLNSFMHVLRFDVNITEASLLFNNSFKFLKKFINDAKFIDFFLQLILLLMQKNIFFDVVQLKVFFMFLYFNQIECFISFFFINKTNGVLNLELKNYFKKITFFVKKALQTCKKVFFTVVLKKKNGFLKINICSLKYKRVNNTFLLFFFGLFSLFLSLKKQLFLFMKFIAFDVKVISAFYFSFLGYCFRFGWVLNKTKKALKKHFVRKIIPLFVLQKSFFNFGLLDIFNKPNSYSLLVNYFSKNLFYWYLSFFHSFFTYYNNCLNFRKFILNVYYICKWSLLFTLAKKHKKSVKLVFINYFSYFDDFFAKYFFKFHLKYKLKKVVSFQRFYYTYKNYLL